MKTLQKRSTKRKTKVKIERKSRLICLHLQLLQHGRLIGKAQVSAAHAQLLGELVEVDLRRNQRGSWEDAFER